MRKILLSGASGFLGTALISRLLQEEDCEIAQLVRGKPSENSRVKQIHWDPIHKQVNLEELEGFDCWIHLSGEDIASGFWSQEKKRRLYASRVLSTDFLAESLKKLHHPPFLFMCASAIGFYGDQKERLVDEASPMGGGYLARLCSDWEVAARRAKSEYTRVVNLRLGVILGKGGALRRMLPPFKMGMGGVVGDGKQYMSWIALEDVLDAIAFIIEQKDLRGPVNLVAPAAVTNADFTESLAQTLNRPAKIPVPAFGLKFALGEMAKEVILASTRVHPKKLLDSGFEFQSKDLDKTLARYIET